MLNPQAEIFRISGEQLVCQQERGVRMLFCEHFGKNFLVSRMSAGSIVNKV
jgi:hypothetical protein